MGGTLETFIAELRHSVAGWRAQAERFEVQGATELAAQIREWISEAEEILRQHDSRND
jgi:hypothetical protein